MFSPFPMKNNPIGWFEIPVLDMDRAITFYETVFGYEMQRQQMGSLDMGWFPMSSESPGAGGSLVCHKDFYTPSAAAGTLVYFIAPSGDLSTELARVEEAGGEIIIPKKQISEEYGYMAVILDTEGNRVALHSPK